jgi:ATP-dependent exoDNAse (exonuclease V) beta subunit
LETTPEIEIEELEEIEEAAPETAPDMELESLAEIEETVPDGAPEMELETLEEFEEAARTQAGESEPLDLEELPEIEEPVEAAVREAPEFRPKEIDLEAIAGESEEELSLALIEEAEAIEVDELEALPEEEEPAAEREIEIPFEEGGRKAHAPLSPAPEKASREEVEELEEVPAEEPVERKTSRRAGVGNIPDDLKDEIRTVLKYMDQLLEALPEEKIQEFAGSEYFVMYKKLFEDLGLGE